MARWKAWALGSAWAMAALVAPADELDDATVTVDGRTLEAAGVIGPQFETRIRSALAAHPGIDRLVVRSPGGLRAQAMRVGELLNRRNVTVRVSGRCASACALLFATARSREMAPEARIGLHRSSLAPDLPISEAMRQQLMERNDRETDDVLRRGGFPARVISLGAATPATTMAWFTADELRVEGLPFTMLAPSSATMASASVGWSSGHASAPR